MGRAVVAAIGGKDPKQALDELAAEWDGLTEQIGVDRQKAAYLDWASEAERLSSVVAALKRVAGRRRSPSGRSLRGEGRSWRARLP